MRFLPFVKSFLNLVSRSFPCYPLRFLSTTAIQHYTCYTPPVKGATAISLTTQAAGFANDLFMGGGSSARYLTT